MGQMMSSTGALGAPAGTSWALQALARVLPLWRHAIWVGALFTLATYAATVRLDVQQLRKDLDRQVRATREAQVLNDRLRLEMDARRRAVAMEAAAVSLNLGPQAQIVPIREAR